MVRVSDGYLTQRRIKNSPDKIEYIQGNYEPIISEEMFLEAGRIREKRWNHRNQKGKRESESAWCGKYLCGCGCGTVRRTAGKGEFIFMCHEQHKNGIRKKAAEDGEADLCKLKTVAEWKLDMIAYYVIKDVWTNREEDIQEALKIIAECDKEENSYDVQEQETMKIGIDRLERRKENLLDMRADGEITKEEYMTKRAEYEKEMNDLKRSLARTAAEQTPSADDKQRISRIKTALIHLFDLSGPKLNREVTEGFIWKLVHHSDREFELYLNMGNEKLDCGGTEEKVVRYKAFAYPDSKKEERIQCTKLKSMTFSYEDAARYRAMSGRRVIRSKWEDLLVHIYYC